MFQQRNLKKEEEDVLNILRIVTVVACLVVPMAAANSFVNWEAVNKQQNEKEQYLVAADYSHPEKDRQSVNKQITGRQVLSIRSPISLWER